MTERVLPEEPTWISEHAVLSIHAQQVERYGGRHGVLERRALLSAQDRAADRWAYDELADWADLAGEYLFGFTRTQGFHDGNARTGLAGALVFLEINGKEFSAPPEELYVVTTLARSGKLDEVGVAAFIRSHLVP